MLHHGRRDSLALEKSCPEQWYAARSHYSASRLFVFVFVCLFLFVCFYLCVCVCICCVFDFVKVPCIVAKKIVDTLKRYCMLYYGSYSTIVLAVIGYIYLTC